MSDTHRASINAESVSIERLAARRSRIKAALGELPESATEKRDELMAELVQIQSKIRAVQDLLA